VAEWKRSISRSVERLASADGSGGRGVEAVTRSHSIKRMTASATHTRGKLGARKVVKWTREGKEDSGRLFLNAWISQCLMNILSLWSSMPLPLRLASIDDRSQRICRTEDIGHADAKPLARAVRPHCLHSCPRGEAEGASPDTIASGMISPLLLYLAGMCRLLPKPHRVGHPSTKRKAGAGAPLPLIVPGAHALACHRSPACTSVSKPTADH